jgi:hypothetical protein
VAALAIAWRASYVEFMQIDLSVVGQIASRWAWAAGHIVVCASLLHEPLLLVV